MQRGWVEVNEKSDGMGKSWGRALGPGLEYHVNVLACIRKLRPLNRNNLQKENGGKRGLSQKKRGPGIRKQHVPQARSEGGALVTRLLQRNYIQNRSWETHAEDSYAPDHKKHPERQEGPPS